MSKVRWTIFGGVCALLAAFNLAPIHRGRLLHCYGGSTQYRTRMDVMGLPFGFLSMNRTGNDCFAVVNGQDQTEQDPTHYDNYFFDPAQFWFDLIISGAILFGAYFMLDSRKAAR